MIKELKEMLKIAQETYQTGVRIAVKKTVEKVLNTVDVDVENGTYYVEMMTEQEAEIATDEQFDKYEIKYHEIYTMLDKVKQELYEMLEEVDEWANVSATLYNDNTISIEVEVDGIEFEIQLENKYNK